MKVQSAIFALSLTFAVLGTAVAHNGRAHLTGTVTSIDAKEMIVQEEEKNRPIRIRLTRDTVYREYSATSPATRDDIKVGCPVVVDLFGMPGGEQTALEIHFSADNPGPPKD